MADLHRKLGAALAVNGERKAAIENYQRGINLLKDGPPRLELVHLYEEAAWLYLQTGDNMLAIYASEKALRLAERLGETRAASRAHGIFGRVFGRIGDNEKARVNLERSVELARGSDPGETIVALLALGRHLELSQADARRCRGRLRRGPGAGRAGRRPAQPGGAARGGGPARRLPGGLGSGAAVHRRQHRAGRARGARVQAVRALRAAGRCSAGATATSSAPSSASARRTAWPSRWAGPSSPSSPSTAWRWCCVIAAPYAEAVAVLAEAADVCERAGLAAQLVQAVATRAVVLALDGRGPQAREAATEAEGLAEPLNSPIGQAASTEARGASVEDPGEAAGLLADARDRWTGLDRPLEAARCGLMASFRLRDEDPGEARRLLDEMSTECDRLGVAHLAERTRALVEA